MAVFKAFDAIRPAGERAQEIAALPYDVYNRREAKEEVKDKPLSFLRIDRAEINFPDTVDTYDDAVYQKAHDLLWDMVDKGYFVRDDKPYYYLYEQTFRGKSQCGLVGLASIDDYDSGVIMRHENTREEKEVDRINHVDRCNAQTGPIFLAYKKNDVIAEIVERTKTQEDIYDFTTEDGVRHRVFIVHNPDDIEKINTTFKGINQIYIADGHHRCASAVKVGKKRREENPGYNGDERFNFFLSVVFPDEELAIMDYNRVIKDLNGKSPKEIIDEIEKRAYVVEIPEAMHPEDKGSFTMHLEGKWYMCRFHDELISKDVVDGLDVSILQNNIIEPIFNISDPRTDARIDFVGGIRGLGELESRCMTDCKIAFAMYPTSIGELFAVADAGRLMPPKSTWFEPKLRSGLFINSLED